MHMNNKKTKVLVLGITALILIAAVLIPVLIINREKTDFEHVQSTTETSTELFSEEFTYENNDSVKFHGWCGEDAFWYYYPEKAMLEISGNGKIDDSSGWDSFASEIESVRVEPDIGDFEISVFDKLVNAEDYYFANTVNEKTVSEFKKSEYYLNRAGRVDGVLYKDNVLVSVDESVSGEFKVKEGTIRIEPHVFYDTGVTKIIVPDSVVTADEALYSPVLKELVIGSGLEYDEETDILAEPGSELYYDSGPVYLENITVSSSNKYYVSIDGVLFSKDQTKLLCYPSAKKSAAFAIPDATTIIAPYAFSNVKNLKKLYIGENVKYIGKFGMYNCPKDHEPADYGSYLTLFYEIYYGGTEEQWQKNLAEYYSCLDSGDPDVYFNCKPSDITSKHSNYKDAYNQYLRFYNGGSYGEEFRFKLAYITDDDIPELIVAKESWHNASCEILTYSDGKVISLYEGGVYGNIEYVERKSLLVINDYRKGYESGLVIKIDDNGNCEEIFSHSNNKDYALGNGEKVDFFVNDKSVSELEYNIAVRSNMPNNTTEFGDGIPMTLKNIEKHCG